MAMNNDAAAFSTTVLTEFPHEVRRVVQRVPLRDGIELSIKLWLPDGADSPERTGVVLEAIPYRKDDESLLDDETRFAYYAGFGIAGARVDLRGSGTSTGMPQDEYSTIEQADLVEVVHWLAAQPWCNGSVGMMGISWSGFNALQVAARRPEPLKAIITVCSTDDRYDNDVHYSGGVPLAFYMNLWGSALHMQNMRPPMPDGIGDDWFAEWVSRLHSNQDSTSLWLSHPTRDAYWRQGSVCEDYPAIECAVLAVGGWADAYTDTVFRLLEHLDAPVQAILGPWGHTWPERPEPGPGIDFLAISVRWWRHWLCGEDNGVDLDPRVRAYVQDYTPSREDLAHRPGFWLAADDIDGIVHRQTWMLGDGGVLAADAIPGAPFSMRTDRVVGTDARHFLPMGVSTDLPPVQDHDDEGSSCFETAPLANPLVVLGRSALRLRVRSDSPSAQVFVRITDVDADGHSHLVARGGLNLAHRDGHAPELVRAVTPGEWFEVDVPLKSTGYRFAPGHRMRVAISTHYWPWFWPSQDDATLEVDPAGSALLLPVLPDDAPVVSPIDLGEPVIAAPPSLDYLGEAVPYWEVGTGVDGETVVRRGHRGERLTVLPSGWTFGTTRDENEYAWRVGDPESARMRKAVTQSYRWDGREAVISLESEMHGDRTSFTVTLRTSATLDGAPVFENESRRNIPRGL
jgi:hypothetical protein